MRSQRPKHFTIETAPHSQFLEIYAAPGHTFYKLRHEDCNNFVPETKRDWTLCALTDVQEIGLTILKPILTPCEPAAWEIDEPVHIVHPQALVAKTRTVLQLALDYDGGLHQIRRVNHFYDARKHARDAVTKAGVRILMRGIRSAVHA